MILFLVVGAYWGLMDPPTASEQRQLSAYERLGRIERTKQIERKTANDSTILSLKLNPSGSSSAAAGEP